MRNTLDLANRDGQSRRRNPLPVLAAMFALFFVALVLFAPAIFSQLSLFAAQYSDDRYAFTLDSGHTFFGTVRGVGLTTIGLSDVYSFQAIEVGDTSTNNLSALRDNPLTSPENWIVLNRAHILFYEKIGEDASIHGAFDAQ